MDITIAFMISIDECKKYIGENKLSNEQIEELRDGLYFLIEKIVDDYSNKVDTMK